MPHPLPDRTHYKKTLHVNYSIVCLCVLLNFGFMVTLFVGKCYINKTIVFHQDEIQSK